MVRANELAASPVDRANRGAWYTPRVAAEAITDKAFGPAGVPEFVVDPTCGGGAFLLAALDAFVARGVSPGDALGRIAGLDIDRGAVETAAKAVGLWAAAHGVDRPEVRINVCDAFGEWPAAWPQPDLILGNPPFASPLRSSKARTSAELPASAAAFRDQHRSELGPYADLAAVHLLNAAHRVAPTRGSVVMVLPQSLLAGRDASPLRAWLTEKLPLVDLWISGDKLFDAGVRVFAPVLCRGATQAPRDPAPSWAGSAATAMGVPTLDLPAGGATLASICQVTAGFRDEYYGMAEACVEGTADDARCRLATVGSIDPLELLWGEVPTRFAKSLWQRPVVDASAVPSKVRPWFDRQRVPKVLLPTQARILEPFVDRTGEVIPITPLLSISAAPEDLDRIAAVLLAPEISVWAARRAFGAALSVNAIKLRAVDVLDVPFPPNAEPWNEAAALVRGGPSNVDRIARLMHEAYGGPGEVMRWWSERRP